MSEAPTAGTSEYQNAAGAAAIDPAYTAPIATQPGAEPVQQPLPVIAAQPAVHPAVAAVIQTAQATNPPASWASEAAAYIQALDPIIQAAEGMSRAGQKTQGYVALAEVAAPVLIGILQRLFPHPAA